MAFDMTSFANGLLHAVAKVPPPKRYCEMCDRWVPAKQTTCKACGAATVKAERG